LRSVCRKRRPRAGREGDGRLFDWLVTGQIVPMKADVGQGLAGAVRVRRQRGEQVGISPASSFFTLSKRKGLPHLSGSCNGVIDYGIATGYLRGRSHG
jgi:hypothetical protein